VTIVGIVLGADGEFGCAVLRYAARGVTYENPPAGWDTARMKLSMSHEHDEYDGTGVLAKYGGCDNYLRPIEPDIAEWDIVFGVI
jgi:hypothetical protein